MSVEFLEFYSAFWYRLFNHLLFLFLPSSHGWQFVAVIAAGFHLLPTVDVSSLMMEGSELDRISNIFQVTMSPLTQSEAYSGRHTCQYCGKLFSRLEYCTDHINAHHLKTKPHTCNVCGVGFSYKTSLHRHKSLMGHKTTGTRFPRGISS